MVGDVDPVGGGDTLTVRDVDRLTVSVGGLQSM